MKKRHWFLIIIAAASVTICILVIKDVIDRRGEKIRQIEYASQLKHYSAVLKSGMTRHEVESFLKSKNREFQQICCNVGAARHSWVDLLTIGNEKAPWYCGEHNVYLALEFEKMETHGSLPGALNSDRLVAITLLPRLEGCL